VWLSFAGLTFHETSSPKGSVCKYRWLTGYCRSLKPMPDPWIATFVAARPVVDVRGAQNLLDPLLDSRFSSTLSARACRQQRGLRLACRGIAAGPGLGLRAFVSKARGKDGDS
jgi:hypothetical protein